MKNTSAWSSTSDSWRLHWKREIFNVTSGLRRGNQKSFMTVRPKRTAPVTMKCHENSLHFSDFLRVRRIKACIQANKHNFALSRRKLQNGETFSRLLRQHACHTPKKQAVVIAEVAETAIWVLAHSGHGHTYCDALPGMRADIDQTSTLLLLAQISLSSTKKCE